MANELEVAYWNLLDLYNAREQVEREIFQSKTLIASLMEKNGKREKIRVCIPCEFEESWEEYLANRYPTYDILGPVEDNESADALVDLILKDEFIERNELNFGDTSISYRIVRGTPEIDQEKLKALDPKLYQRLLVERTITELSQEKLDEELTQNPDLLSLIEETLVTKRAPYASVVVGGPGKKNG